MMAMGRALRRSGPDCHLHFCAPDEVRAPFLSEVKEIFNTNLSLHFDGGDPSKGLNLAKLLETPLEGDHVYVCGPPSLVSDVRSLAHRWPEDRCIGNSCSSASESTEQNEPFEIVLSRLQMKLQVGEEADHPGCSSQCGNRHRVLM